MAFSTASRLPGRTALPVSSTCSLTHFGRRTLPKPSSGTDLFRFFTTCRPETGRRASAASPAFLTALASSRRASAAPWSMRESLGCPQLNCLVGLTPTGVDAERVRQILVDNLRFAAGELGRSGVRLLVEPVNSKDIPGFHLNRVDKAVAVLDDVGSPNAFLQFDFYHQQRMDGELLATYRRLKDRIAHVQIADNPGRHEPGTGEVNYPFLFEALDREGYEGWIGCEYKPKTTTSAGLAWAAEYRGAPVGAN